MKLKYVVWVDDKEVKAFDDKEIAEDFRKSVGGSMKVQDDDGTGIPVSRRATQGKE